MMKHDHFLYVLRFLHFCDNINQVDKTGIFVIMWGSTGRGRLRKIGYLYGNFNDAYAKFYSPSEHLALDKVIILFKVRVIVKKHIPRGNKHWFNDLRTVWYDWLCFATYKSISQAKCNADDDSYVFDGEKSF
jgi:hypothetical protein